MRFTCLPSARPSLSTARYANCTRRRSRPRKADHPRIHKTSDNVKNRQELRWHSKGWFRIYRVGRNSTESLDDTVKDDIELDRSSHRPMRGIPTQQLAFALLMVAMNLKRIIEFEHHFYILDKRTQEGRPTRPRKQKHELLQRRRDRLGRSDDKRPLTP